MKYWSAFLSVVLFVGSAGSANAQDGGRVEVAGGYSFLHDSTLFGLLLGSSNAPIGWVASGTRFVRPAIGLVGEVGGTYMPVRGYGGPGSDLWIKVHTFMVGAKVLVRTHSVATPFAQLMAGPTVLTYSVYGRSESHAYASIQPGGGVDITITPRMALRAGADYRVLYFGLTGFNTIGELRVTTGFVFRP